MELPPSVAASIYQHGWRHAAEALLAVDCTRDVVLAANPAAALLSGYAPDELPGMPVSRLWLPMVDCAVPSESATVRGAGQLLCRHGARLAVECTYSAPVTESGITLAIFRLRPLRNSEQPWALAAYAASIQALSAARSPAVLMQHMCTALVAGADYRLAWIATPADAEVLAAAGPAAAAANMLAATGMAEFGQQHGAVRLATTEDYAALPWVEPVHQAGINAWLSIPLQIEGTRTATLVVCAADRHAFTPPVIEVLQGLAEQIAIGCRVLEQEERLQRELANRALAQQFMTNALTATVRAMAATMEKRDSYTAGHQDRVSQIAFAIARELGWADDRMLGLQMAALVHDIGKIGVPIEILTKPGRLTVTEFALIAEHPETGYWILKDIPFSWPVADIVRQHHERVDGSGYPQHLHTDTILPEAKILAVADTVEAMASYRPYRPALGLEFALNEIGKQAGQQLDSDIVQVCTSLFRDKQFVLPHADANWMQ